MTRATRLTRDEVVAASLAVLDEVGLDGVSTRRVAQRLGVEQPSLYWHFHHKGELLAAMAEAAMAPHAETPLPGPGDDHLAWFRENTRSLRRTLLMHRDGARLHAGSRPGEGDVERIDAKLEFLVAGGLARPVAEMAMLAASRFTVGSVLEEQADEATSAHPRRKDRGSKDTELEHAEPEVDHEAAFEAGLGLIVAGLEQRRGGPDPADGGS